MAFNGTGTFNRIYNWVTDKNNSVPITASRMDAEMDGMATGLSTCITKDGQTTITANIPMNTKKFTGLNTGNARTDSIALSQVQDNQFLDAGTTGGSADAYTITLSPVITAYVATMQFAAKIHAINTTTTPYLQFNSIANPSSTAVIKKLNLSGTEVAVEAGDLIGNHQFKRNSANDAWIVLDPKKPYINGVNITTTFSNRNVIINGAMAIDQRNAGASQTITAGAALAYTIDRWYAYSTGANVTGQRVAGTAPNQYNYQFTGAASVTKIGFAQRIEAANSQHLAGQTTKLSVDLANSLLTTVTWTAWYANTADTFGTLASPTRTQIATGTFTVSSTLTRFDTSISIPSVATTGIEIEFSVAAQTSGTFTIGRVELELGSTASAFEYRAISQEILLCQRYYARIGGGTGNYIGFGSGTVSNATSGFVYVKYPTTMRAVPALTQSNTAITANTTAPVTSLGTSYIGFDSLMTNLNCAGGGLTAGHGATWNGDNNNAAYIELNSEL